MQVIQQKSCIVEGTMEGWKDGRMDRLKQYTPIKLHFAGGGGGVYFYRIQLCINARTR